MPRNEEGELKEERAWWRSLPCPGVSRRRNLGCVRAEVSFSERNRSSGDRVVDDNWQSTVSGAWLVCVAEEVPFAN